MNACLPLPKAQFAAPFAPAQDRRYLCVSLPRLSTDRILRARHGPGWRSAAPDRLTSDRPPLVVAGKRDNAVRLLAVCDKAATAGLACGQGLADARAMIPGVEVAGEDAAGDRALAEAVADWCDRYTPLVALDPAGDGLTLDITGCAHLFGGEEALLSDLLLRLFHQGFAATAAIASTPGAAWAVARFRPEGPRRPKGPGDPPAGPVVPRERTAQALANLPLAALRLSGETLSGLARLGLRTIGQAMARPRGPLARRFGAGLILRLDQALGAAGEAISPRLPAPDRTAERRLAEPIGRIEDVEAVAASLARTLCEAMERAGEGARVLDLALFRVDGAVTRLGVGTSRPLRDPARIVRLFRERLAGLGDELDAGYGFDLARLSAAACERFDPQETGFLDREEAGAPADLVDRLTARLGAGSVLRGMAGDSHVPERMEALLPACETPPAAAFLPAFAARARGLPPLYPLRLLARPEPVEALAAVPDGPPVRFRWRRVAHEVVRAEGPQRIGAEWWRAPDRAEGETARDYFRVEDGQGRRFWLFRQGLYGATAQPRWFLHGLFA